MLGIAVVSGLIGSLVGRVVVLGLTMMGSGGMMMLLLLLVIGEGGGTESRLVHACTVLSLVRLCKMMLNEKLLLKLLMGSRLLVWLRDGKSLCIPCCGTVWLSIVGRHVATTHHVLSCSTSGCSGKTGRLRRLPDAAVVHGCRWGRGNVAVGLAVVLIRIPVGGVRSRDRTSHAVGLLVVVRVLIHGITTVKGTEGARKGLAVGVEGHHVVGAAGASTPV